MGFRLHNDQIYGSGQTLAKSQGDLPEAIGKQLCINGSDSMIVSLQRDKRSLHPIPRSVHYITMEKNIAFEHDTQTLSIRPMGDAIL